MDHNKMQGIIKEFLQTHRIPEKAKFIIAVSGGPDSVALLHLFKYLNLNILALHCNFGLRGKESNQDEQFVKRFCNLYGIPLSVKQFQTSRYAEEKGISIEMAARELRYEWFREMKDKKKVDYIVTAHHADDLAETIFINICRGTGLKGLSGIKPVNGDLLRPLLNCSRTDILQYIEKHQLGFRTDSTNNSLEFVRNKIRHKIIPVCKEINPAFLNTIRENCEILKETEEIYTYAIEKLKKEVSNYKNGELLLHIQKILTSPAPYTLLYEILKPAGFNKSQVRDILNGSQSNPGKQFISGKFILTKGRDYWRLFESQPAPFVPFQIEQPGNYKIKGIPYRFEILPVTAGFQIPTDPGIACLDADKVIFPLTIRCWEKGDRFCPLGMKKLQKKLSDFFTDLKFSPKQKRECLLLLSSNQIAWVIGYRIDDRFKTGPLTQRILKIYPLR